MAIISIQRDQNNTISIVRMQVSDTLATVSMTDYILNNQAAINALNGGTWQWFITDMVLVAAEDGNAFYEFVDTTFATMVIFGQKGTGTVNPGLQNNIPYYAANGNTLSPLSNLANAILATNNSSVPGLTQTLPSAVQLNISSLGTIGTGVWNGTPVTVPFGGSGLSSLTAYAVLCGGTTSTGNMQQVSGLGTSGFILTSNGPGALPTWQVSPGSGTVSPGLQNQLAYYAANGSTVSGLTSIASGVLVTSGLGVPSISQTLPSAVQGNITTVGTITAGAWQSSTKIALAFGGTNANLTATAGAIVFSTASALAFTAAGTSGQLLSSAGTGTPVWTTNTFPSTDAKGDLLYASAANTIGGLAIGSTGQILTIASGLPAWSTATYPSTTTINQLLYSSSNNVVAGVTAGNFGVLISSSSGVPSWLTNGTTGQVLTATTSGIPSWASPAASSVTFTGDSGTPFSGATVTISGGTTGLTFTASTPSLTLSGTLKLVNGGTNNALTASAGGIVWSDASKLNILAGTATAGQLLLSGSAATPSWSTSTYPSTNAANTLLYASSANTMAALATANNSVLGTNGSGVPAWTTSLPTAVQVGVNSLNSGTSASSSTFWRGDGTWAAPAGSGTVNSGTSGQLAYYASTGTAVSGLTTGTGVTTALGVNVGTAGAFVVNGGALGTPSSGNLSNCSNYPFKAPTVQIFTSGSGTYTTPTSPSPLYIRVRAVAGGGGGGGSGTTNGGGQTSGGNTTFGSIISLAGGSAGTAGVFGGSGGTGGGVTTNTASPGGLAVAGGNGIGGVYGPSNTGVLNTPGGTGGNSIFGGAGASSFSTGNAGQTNTGAGGAGGACVSAGPGGGGGGADAGCDVLISSPSATYSYAVGAAGTAGAAGTSGAIGYAGGSGLIIVEEYYQ